MSAIGDSEYARPQPDLRRLEFPKDRELLRSFHRLYDREYGFSRTLAEEDALLDYIEEHAGIYHCIVLFEAGGPVGYMRAYERISTSSCDKVLMLDLVYVHPDRRGKGAGKKLVAGLLDHATRCGAARIDLLADLGNDAAQKLYKSFGFEGRTRMQMHRFIKRNDDLDRYFRGKVESEGG